MNQSHVAGTAQSDTAASKDILDTAYIWMDHEGVTFVCETDTAAGFAVEVVIRGDLRRMAEEAVSSAESAGELLDLRRLLAEALDIVDAGLIPAKN